MRYAGVPGMWKSQLHFNLYGTKLIPERPTFLGHHDKVTLKDHSTRCVVWATSKQGRDVSHNDMSCCVSCAIKVSYSTTAMLTSHSICTLEIFLRNGNSHAGS